jgi:lipopolysaccharide/colanic/teichoic acid biosynthesis glycosyltransferase
MDEYRIINPKANYMLLNLLLLGLSFFLVIWIFPFTNDTPFFKYWQPYLIIYIPISFFCGIAFKKYHSFRRRSIRNVLKSVLTADLLAFAISALAIFIFPQKNLSVNVLEAFVGILLILEYIVVMTYFSLKNAINIERFQNRREIENKTAYLKKDYLLDTETITQIENFVEHISGKQTLEKLKEKTRLNFSNTIVVHTTTIFNIANLKNNRFSTIINLSKCNNIRSINEFMIAVYDKLPYDGEFIGCFLSKSQYKKNFLEKFPWGINYLLYSFIYLFKRVFPKMAFTREFYFWVTRGKRRILAKPEIYGRLYASGFDVVDEFRANGLNYFVAKKKNEPMRMEIVNYGAIIKLNRVGKNGKLFKVYKFRTMHAYSEFLQPYIYEHNNLQEGGKFAHDIRISSLGKFMRKYWLDELPMLFNLLKGDMKFVGIRPLSKHYFSLYSPELQQKRTKVKPGLLPPYYADMPKTLEEIQASELKYLNECEKNGTFVTDIKYIWLIFVNIFFKKARSR